MEADRVSKDLSKRPPVFEKMEGLVRELQDEETGVPVRSQKLFLTSIPAAFMGYDLIEWLMERLGIEESEALNLANQLCQYGYVFPVGDLKTLVLRDDSSLYRFQGSYFWPGHKPTDAIEYAAYLVKRSLRNRQRHALEDYEVEALTSMKKNLANKWELITTQAEEDIKSGKLLRKVDKIVRDSQERAYWRLYRPPPGTTSSSYELCPVPNTLKDGSRVIRRTVDSTKKEAEFFKSSLLRTRIRVSQALETLVQYVETFTEYDPTITPVQPTNPWVSEDVAYWQFNNPLVENPTEKRVRRWGFSMEELVSDPTGIQEFTNYLRKEYSHENIRFWIAVNDLRRSSLSQIQRKVKEIFAEFLAPGAPCEINIDGKTMEKVHQEMKSPTRFTFDAAQEHVYTLLLKKDCYPRFIRSEHYKNLLASGVQPTQKKRFFGFGPVKKKSSTSSAPNPAHLQQQPPQGAVSAASSHLAKRRGSDRSLSGSAHELAISGVKDTKVPHSHSQSNLSDIPYRGDLPCQSKGSSAPLPSPAEVSEECAETDADSTCRARKPGISVIASASTSQDICPWETAPESKSRKNSSQLDSCSSSSDVSSAITEVSDRFRRSCGITQQSTFDGDRRGQSSKKLSTALAEQRRASVSVPFRHTDLRPSVSSFEESAPATSVTAPVSPAITSDTDNKIEEFASTKTCRLTKTCSVTGANAPIISVSSVLEDAATEAVQIDEEGQEEEEQQLLEEKSIEREHKILERTELCISDNKQLSRERQVSEQQMQAECEMKEQKVNEEASQQNSAPLAKPEGTDERASNDVCPWEDEESCKTDVSFVKTYSTLGYL